MYPPLFGTGGTLFMSPEHAYQTMKIWHCLGKEHKLAEEVTAAEDGYQAKSVSKNVPYSKSWEQKKKSIVAEICQIRSDQDVAFRDTLNESMNKKIVHNVNNNYWGTGGPDRSGLNTYGKIDCTVYLYTCILCLFAIFVICYVLITYVHMCALV